MRATSAVVPALLLTLLAGCDSSPGGAPRAEPLKASVPASGVSTPTEESSGPPPTSGPVHRLGDRVRLVTGSRMTVFGWQRVTRPGGPAAGDWWAADIGFCMTRTFGDDFQEPIGNIRSALVAELPDGTALEADGAARSSDEVFAQPDGLAVAGHCQRGSLVFDVPAGAEPAYLAVTVSPFSWVRWQLS